MKNPFENLTWKAFPAVVLFILYAGLGIIYTLAFKLIDGAVFLSFGIGMYWYVKKVKQDNLDNWYEVEDIED